MSKIKPFYKEKFSSEVSIYIQGESSLRSLSPCSCVEVFEWLLCTVLYQGPCSDLQFMFIPLASLVLRPFPIDF